MNLAVGTSLAAILVATACGSPSPSLPEAESSGDGGPIRYQRREITAESGDCATGDAAACARVRIAFPEPAGGGSGIARDNVSIFLEHDLVSRMRGFVPEDDGRQTADLDALAAVFLARHREFTSEFPDAAANWFIEIDADESYNTAAVTTLDIVEHAYTGGAHPNTRRRLASFEVPSGRLIGLDDLAADRAALRGLVERRLRLDRGLAPDDDLEAAGFWLSDGELPLTDNLGVVDDGLLFHWDPYEIAPYAMGPTDVIVAVAELEGVVDLRYW